ncbi:MAG: hypothetical protein ACR2MX_17190 [Cyclobacteriaceae bacterium]
MKSYKKSQLGWGVLLLLGIFLLACEEETPNDPGPGNNPGPTPQTNIDANTLNQGLVFNDAQLISGTMPANSNLADLKINKDTINIWPGINARIEIQNHNTIAIGSILVQIPGADGYYQAAVEEEESTDSISVFYVDIDPKGLDLPLNGDIIISPADLNGEVIDEFDHPLHVDTPFNENVGSGPDGTGQGTCKPALRKDLFWIYTSLEGKFWSAPGFPFYQSDYEVEGCCFSGRSQVCGTAAPNSTVAVTEQYARTESQYLYFFEDNLGYAYEMEKTFNDYDPDKTDFCSSTPGYSFRKPGIYTGGEYSITPNSFETVYNVIIHTLDFTTKDALDVGFFPTIIVNEGLTGRYKYSLGCRYFIYEVDIEGTKFLRVYENVEDFDLWYD